MLQITVFIIFILAADFTRGWGEITVNPEKTLAKLEESVHLSCESADKFTTCSWYQTNGEESCDNIPPQAMSQCGGRSNPHLFYNSTDTSCGLTITGVHAQHNGNWTCRLTNQDSEELESQAELIVFSQGNFECTTYGTVTVKVGETIVVDCFADHARPAGDIIWKIGDTQESSQRKEESSHKVTPMENDMWRLDERLEEAARIEEDGQTIWAIYEQRDLYGNVIYTKAETLDLKVNHLNIYQKNIIQPKEGQTVNISVEIQSSSEPDVIWMIQGGQNIVELSQENQRFENYVWYPAQYQEMSRPSKYTSILQIVNATQKNAESSFSVRVKTKDELMGKEPIKVDFSSFGVDMLEPVGSNTTLIIIIVVILLIIIILVTLGVVCYAKKNNKLCFATSDGGRQSGVNEAEPLQDQSKDILKPGATIQGGHHTATSRP